MISLEHYDAVQKLCEERCRSVLKEVDRKEFQVMIVEAYEKKIMSKKRLYDGLSDKERLEEKIKYLKFLIKEYDNAIDKSMLKEEAAMMTDEDDKKVLEDEDSTFFDTIFTSAVAGLNDLPSILSAIDYIPGIRDISDIINSSIVGMSDSTEKQEIIADIAISKIELNLAAITTGLAGVSMGTAEAISWVLELIVHALIFLYYLGRMLNNLYKGITTEKSGDRRINYFFRAAMDYVDCGLQLVSLLELFPAAGNAIPLFIRPMKFAQDIIRKIGWKGMGLLLGTGTLLGFIAGSSGAVESFSGTLGLMLQVRGGGLPGLKDNALRVDILKNVDKQLDTITTQQKALDMIASSKPEIRNLGENIRALNKSIEEMCDGMLNPSVQDQVVEYLGMIGRQQDAQSFFKAVQRLKEQSLQYTIDFVKYSKLKGADITNETDLYKIIASNDPEMAFFLRYFGKIDESQQAAIFATGMAVTIKSEQITKVGKTGNKRVLSDIGGDTNLLPDDVFKSIANDVLNKGPEMIKRAKGLKADMSNLNNKMKQAVEGLDDLTTKLDSAIAKISKEAAEAMHDAYFSKLNDSYIDLARTILARNPSASLADPSYFKTRGRVSKFIEYVDQLKNTGIISDVEYESFILNFNSLFQNHLGQMAQRQLKASNADKNVVDMLVGFEKMLGVFSNKHADSLSNEFPRTWRYFNTAQERTSRQADQFEFDLTDYKSETPILYRILSPSILLELTDGSYNVAVKVLKKYDNWVGNNFDYNAAPFTNFRFMLTYRLKLVQLAYLRLSTRVGIGSALNVENLCTPEAQEFLRSIGNQKEYRAGLVIAQTAAGICKLKPAKEKIEKAKEEIEEIKKDAKEKGIEIGNELEEIYEELTTEGEPVDIGGGDSGSGEDVQIGGEKAKEKGEEEGEDVQIGG